ncbi:hypothetical protein JTB14_006358 [Gonioctena quinquepunctata]|nr:hypothetical protein JTB14_006358 [Gonioctena quinquepunctata]
MPKAYTFGWLVKNGQTLLFTVTKWKNRQNDRLIVQCNACQQWRHATSNCFKQPYCMCRAATYKNMTKARGLDNGIYQLLRHTPIVCPVYNFKVNSIETRKTNTNKGKNEQFLLAPIPEESAWNKRSIRKPQEIQGTPGSPYIPYPNNDGSDNFDGISKRIKITTELVNIPQIIKDSDVVIQVIRRSNGNRLEGSPKLF